MKIISEKQHDAITLTCEFLRQGKVVAFATDTVYGIAVDAANSKAVERLYNLKKRDAKKPIAIFVKEISVAENIFYFDKISKRIADKFLPGKLTLVLKTRTDSQFKIAKNLNCETENFLGFRLIERDFVKKLFAEFDGILAVTSANIAGHEAALNVEEIIKYFSNSNIANLDLIIDGGSLLEKNVSTVVKISDEKISILRHGAIKESLIKNCLL